MATTGAQQPQRLLTVREVAQRLAVSESTVRRHRHELPFPLVRIGHQLRFTTPSDQAEER
jgi:excisionase family DNA binding protein